MTKKVMKVIYSVALVLLIIGGLNWGLLGLFHFNLVEYLLGSVAGLSQAVYILVGVSAILIAVKHLFKKKK